MMVASEPEFDRASADRPGSLSGLVLATQANYYRVQLQPDPRHPLPVLLCTRRSRLKKLGQQVMVGDRVVIEEPDWEGGRGAIAAVLPRQSELDRPAIANIDQILLVFALADPPLDPHQLSRFLVKAETTGLSVCLGLNKVDLITPAERQHWQERLHQWGYQPLFLSVQQALGLDDLTRHLQSHITVLAGPSGVGKSSLINHLIPQAQLRVGQVSGKLNHGRHTTRHVELLELPCQGLLADTPGFNQPSLDCTPGDLIRAFPEVRQQLAEGTCEFSDCLHYHEPHCAIQGNWERYDHYRLFLKEVLAYQSARNQQANPEKGLKAKTGQQGEQSYEPRLAAKKYRRVSRRVQNQTLSDLYQDLEVSDR